MTHYVYFHKSINAQYSVHIRFCPPVVYTISHMAHYAPPQCQYHILTFWWNSMAYLKKAGWWTRSKWLQYSGTLLRCTSISLVVPGKNGLEFHRQFTMATSCLLKSWYVVLLMWKVFCNSTRLNTFLVSRHCETNICHMWDMLAVTDYLADCTRGMHKCQMNELHIFSLNISVKLQNTKLTTIVGHTLILITSFFCSCFFAKARFVRYLRKRVMMFRRVTF